MPELPETLRAFVAIPVPEAITRPLQRVQRDLQAALGADLVRWTAADQIHLTLKFLGNVPAPAIAEIEAALRGAANPCPPLSLRAAGLGGFPDARRPRVIWVGLHGDLALLAELQARVEAALGRWGEREASRPFHPHLTLGRVREAAGRQTARVGEAMTAMPAPALGAWEVTGVDLMRSELSPQGAVHTRLATLPLRATTRSG